MKTTKKLISTFILIGIIISACSSTSGSETISLTTEPASQTSLATAQPTSDGTLPQTPQSVTVSPNGTVIYDDGNAISAINPDTGEAQVLLSRAELNLILKTENKSAESYTFGFESPAEIKLSPDFRKALITICSSLDVRFRCVFENFVYGVEQKIAVRLPLPPESHGVYWQWAPDSASLVGAAWGYENTTYETTRLYSVKDNGAELYAIMPIENGHWQFAWNPNGKVIHPLTFITNFQSVYVDGSTQEDISVPLEWNEKVECLSFSPDASQVVFVVSKEQPKDYDYVYLANADFTNIQLVNEYEVNARYACNVNWSPTQEYVQVQYQLEIRREAGDLPDSNNEFPSFGKIIQLSSASVIQPNTQSSSCLWSPVGDLVFEKKPFAGQGTGIELFNLSSSSFVSLPIGLQAKITTCPIAWVKEIPSLNIPSGLPVFNACRPNNTPFFDEDDDPMKPMPPLFNIMAVSSKLNGEELSAELIFEEVAPEITGYLSPGVPASFPNGWEILIDVDNDALTGDQLGIEYRLSTGVITDPVSGKSTLGRVVLQFNSGLNSFEKVEGGFNVFFNPATKSITFTGVVPGISTDSRLVFLSRQIDKLESSGPSVNSDKACN